MKQQRFWLIAIPILIALSAWVMFSSHYDPKRHVRVSNYPIKYGLDIKGGVRTVLEADTSKAPGGIWTPALHDQIVKILEQRINSTGVGEATVQPKGTDQFIIELPDVKNKNAILEQLGTTAQMTFYYFQDVASSRVPNNPVTISVSHDPSGKEITTFFDRRTNQSFRDGAQVRADYNRLLLEPTNPRPTATLYTVTSPLSDTPGGTPLYLTADQITRVTALQTELHAWQDFIAHEPIVLSGSDILPDSKAELGGVTQSEPTVTQEFDSAGSSKFADFTSEHTNEIMGIVLDDAVLSAPTINEPILDGRGEISGGFSSLPEAQALANLLNAGALPIPLHQIQTESVEATLGAGAVHKSVVAGLIGLSLVLLFMLLYYRLPGLVADVALLIYALFVLAIFRGGLQWLFPGLVVTLTLPGIAGFILSIGMAVDANILIFERLKEELRSGKSLRTAIDAGFRRAFSAIRDSNTCTAITCIVLLSFGTPSVRGFALTLLIGVAVSLFSAITVTRTLLYLLVNAGIGTNPVLFGLNVRAAGGHANDGDAAPTGGGVNIIGRRKFFYVLSLLIIVPGLVFWLGLNGLRKSIEFTGGTQIQVQYPRSVSVDSVRVALLKGGFRDPIIQMAENGTIAIVSTARTSPVPNENLNPVHNDLMSALQTVAPASELSFDKVEGTISRELTSKAIQAVMIASALIVVYLAFMFSIGGFLAGLRFGTSAIVALLHDVLVLLGLFAIFGYFWGWKIDSLFVTALLTVIGFSVHDTVVIFDRVRENLHHKQRGETFEPLVNRSIQQSLARSINTSLTVLMTLAALIIWGGQTTQLLNTALFIGILSGTYSSIFNASAILVDWESWLVRRRGEVAVAPATSIPRAVAAVPSAAASPRTLFKAMRPTPGNGTPKPSSVAEDKDDASRIRPKRKKPVRRF